MTLGKTLDGRLSEPYISEVNSFIDFAIVVVDSSGNIPYQCIQCVNFYRNSRYVVRIHLLCHEIMQSYTKWYNHREPRI